MRAPSLKDTLFFMQQYTYTEFGWNFIVYRIVNRKLGALKIQCKNILSRLSIDQFLSTIKRPVYFYKAINE